MVFATFIHKLQNIAILYKQILADLNPATFYASRARFFTTQREICKC